MIKKTLFSLALIGALAVPLQSQADAQVSATFDVSGSSGNWLLDFSFTNLSSVTSGQYLYYMGVNTGSVSGSPGGFAPYTSQSWLNSSFWTDNSTIFTEGIGPGATRSGFVTTLAAADAPTSVNWWAYTYNGSSNPRFTGTATRVSVPEPGAMMLLATGMFGLVGIRRRRQDLGEDS